MKKDLTEIVFILDMSGSMDNLADDTIGGFNSLINDQRNGVGESYVTTVLFNHKYILLHDHVNITEIADMTCFDYIPCGTTALLDAVGKTIDSVGKRLSGTPEYERPEKVMFVIVTDGDENSSTEYSLNKIKDMIEHQQSKYSWTFMFIGANIDAITEAERIGINPDFAKSYTANTRGTSTVYSAVSKSIGIVKTSGVGLKGDIGYTAITDALNEIE